MNYDIIIIGGGMVGLTLACALVQKTSLSIAVLEANEKKPAPYRVSAISLSSQRIFSALGVWQAIQAKGASTFTRIKVWDEAAKAEIEFDSRDIAEPLLGYIIENDVIQAALQEKLQTYSQVSMISPIKLVSSQHKSQGIEIIAEDGRAFNARLAIAADGAHSWLRHQANIAVNKVDYEQSGLVATVKTAQAHDQVARQIFLPSGPLAFLPLADPYESSIVWSMPVEKAKELLALEVEYFKRQLAGAFAYHLGDIIEVGPRFIFPLYQQQAASYIENRVALVGDAAHVVHPLAGQGVNTGLLDAARLAEIVMTAQQQNRDFSSAATLRRYERWSRADNQLMLAGIDKIKKLFANESYAAQRLRALGLTVTNQTRLLKNIFIRHAVGNRAGLPPLTR